MMRKAPNTAAHRATPMATRSHTLESVTSMTMVAKAAKTTNTMRATVGHVL